MYLTIGVGTESELKIRAVKEAFLRLKTGLKEKSQFDLGFVVKPFKAKSSVSDQPLGTEEMEQGAVNRAMQALANTDADIGIGIENGLVQENGRYYDPTCVAIVGNALHPWAERFPAALPLIAFGAFFPIPTWMAEEVFTNKTELGEVVKKYAGGGEKDPMKYLSNGIVLREELLTQAVLCALTRLMNPGHYKEPMK